MEQQVRVEPDAGGVRVIVCAGEFEYYGLDALESACAAAAADPEVRRIVLDVRQVTFADSSMLTLMLLLRRSGRLVLAGPLPVQLDRRMTLTAIRDLFPVVDGTENARAV
ncbi:STAS domain-containing protein [Streptomyces sp. NPDC058701]|uniref:STAS domain-containing protein n=1 Tax=Streptomyces sp. NPDC058701 TaxID=3346608 RepID=UPI0036650E7C